MFCFLLLRQFLILHIFFLDVIMVTIYSGTSKKAYKFTLGSNWLLQVGLYSSATHFTDKIDPTARPYPIISDSIDLLISRALAHAEGTGLDAGLCPQTQIPACQRVSAVALP
jgi:hypothetical protein